MANDIIVINNEKNFKFYNIKLKIKLKIKIIRFYIIEI